MILVACRKAMKDIDIISHQASLGSVPRSVDDPLLSHMSNVNGFLNILIAAKENNVKRIVYASSSSVYGDDKNLPKVENCTGNLLSPYAGTKAIDEIYGEIFTRCYEMECIGLRYFNIFGPRQNPNGSYAVVIPKFITAIKNNVSPVIYGDGNYSRDFTYIDDAVSANILALSTTNDKCYGEAFNIGAGGRTSIIDLFNTIKESIGSTITPKFTDNRPGDIPHSNASIKKAITLFKYNPLVQFLEGIKKTINYY